MSDCEKPSDSSVYPLDPVTLTTEQTPESLDERESVPNPTRVTVRDVEEWR